MASKELKRKVAEDGKLKELPETLPMAERRILRSQMKKKQSEPLLKDTVVHDQGSKARVGCMNRKMESIHQTQKQTPSKKPQRTFCTPGPMGALLHTRKQQSQRQLDNDFNCDINLPRSLKTRPCNDNQICRDVDQEALAEDNNMDMIHASSDDEDDGEDDGEDDDEDDAGDEAESGDASTTQLEDESPLISTAQTKKKTRGPTLLTHVHARKPHERHVIFLNLEGQPIGPSEDIVLEFSCFLGTLAKDSILAPLNYMRWDHLPNGTSAKIWERVLRCYVIADQ